MENKWFSVLETNLLQETFEGFYHNTVFWKVQIPRGANDLEKRNLLRINSSHFWRAFAVWTVLERFLKMPFIKSQSKADFLAQCKAHFLI